jgi:hypothetical protein
MPESTEWGTFATSLAALEARVRRDRGSQGAVVSPQRDAVRRLYVRTVLATRTLRAAAASAGAPAPAAIQRLVHRLVDSMAEDEAPWLALTAVRRLSRGPHVIETHAVNVAVLAVALARALGLERGAQAEVGFAALLHDVAQTAGADPDRHDLEGAAWLIEWAPVDCVATAAAVAAGHCTRPGRGVAMRTGIDDGGVATRIVRIADAYDVLAGRDGACGSPDLVLAFFLQGTGARFDAGLLKVFARVVGIYPPGTCVRLRDGAVGVVVRPNRHPDVLDRPFVRIVVDASGRDVEAETILDLAADRGEIVATLDPAVHGLDPAALALGR